METFEINAELREDVGKGASRRLRHAGKLPGILYGAGADPVNLTLAHNELLRHLEEEAFYSHILDLNLAGKVEKVVLKDLQRHPSKAQVLHIDFQRIDANTKLHMHVPLHFLNEDTCPGKKGGGVIDHHIIHVEVSCLPKDLPEYIEIDIADLDIGGSVTVGDITLPAGVELHHVSADASVVSCQKTRAVVDDEGAGEDAAAADGEGEAEE